MLDPESNSLTKLEILNFLHRILKLLLLLHHWNRSFVIIHHTLWRTSHERITLRKYMYSTVKFCYNAPGIPVGACLTSALMTLFCIQWNSSQVSWLLQILLMSSFTLFIWSFWGLRTSKNFRGKIKILLVQKLVHFFSFFSSESLFFVDFRWCTCGMLDVGRYLGYLAGGDICFNLAFLDNDDRYSLKLAILMDRKLICRTQAEIEVW